MRKLALFMLSEFLVNVIMEALLLDFTNPNPAFSYINAHLTRLRLLLSNSKVMPLKSVVS